MPSWKAHYCSSATLKTPGKIYFQFPNPKTDEVSRNMANNINAGYCVCTSKFSNNDTFSVVTSSMKIVFKST